MRVYSLKTVGFLQWAASDVYRMTRIRLQNVYLYRQDYTNNYLHQFTEFTRRTTSI